MLVRKATVFAKRENAAGAKFEDDAEDLSSFDINEEKDEEDSSCAGLHSIKESADMDQLSEPNQHDK